MLNFVEVRQSRWEISGTLSCQSPLHIGDGDWLEERIPRCDRKESELPEVASVFTMPDGNDSVKPYLPGTSLKGWLRSFAEQVWAGEDGVERVRCLFGERKEGAQAGALEFHDAPLSLPATFLETPPRDWDPERKTCVAPHVVIHRHTGAASHSLLFFEEFVPEGSEFKVTITAERLEQKHLRAFLDLLSRFESGCPARLGGQLSNHYGVVCWQRGDIKGLTREGLTAWLSNPDRSLSSVLSICQIEDLESQLPVFETANRWLTFKVILNVEGGFLANDPYRSKPKRSRQQVDSPDLADAAPRKKPGGSYFLPASSIRGSLRSQAERIQRSLNRPASDPSSLKRDQRPAVVRSLEDAKDLDLPAKLFGSTGWRALLQPTDFIAESAVAYRQEFVAIDRFTGGSANQKKFNADALWQPRLLGRLKVDVQRLLRSADDPEPLWALLYFVLRDLADGFIPIGHGAAKGFGACTATVEMENPEDWGPGFGTPTFKRLLRIEPGPFPRSADGALPQPSQLQSTPAPGGRFFNPYHFIPLSETPAYAVPPVSLKRDDFFKPENLKAVSHASYGETLRHGRIYCELRNLTPLFIGSNRAGDGSHPQPVLPSCVPGTRTETYPGDPIVPASSLRGMISSFAEAASNSALRVLANPPVYSRRSVVNPMLRLNEALSAIGVLVKRVKDGQTSWYLRPLCLPMEKNGTFRPFWQRVFPEPRLRVYRGSWDLIRSDDYLGPSPTYKTWTPSNRAMVVEHVEDHTWSSTHAGLEVVPAGDLKTSGVLLGAEPNRAMPARQGIVRILGCSTDRSIPATKKHELWLPFEDAATFAVTGPWDLAEQNCLFKVPQPVIDQFRLLSNEMTAATRDSEAMKPYEPHGTRARKREEPLEPEPGDLVYFQCHEVRGAVEVTELSFSSIWRKPIRGTAAEFFSKVHQDFLPLGYELRNAPRLTMAEGMFGVAESRERESEDALVALKSRIRFSDGRWDGELGAAPWMEPASPKILSSPKPPSPAMYFRNVAGDQDQAIYKRDLHLGRHVPQGRKHYLHHTRALQYDDWKAPESEATGEHADQYVRIQPLTRNQTFKFHIDFENLTTRELGLLLFALHPREAFSHKLGMGKPYGLGSVQVTPTSLCVWWPDLRYSEPGADLCWEDPENLLNPSKWAEAFSPLPEIANAIAAIGTKSYGNVRYPVTKDSNAGGLRTKTYEWFVANELGSKDGHGHEELPAGKVLRPIADDARIPPLPFLAFWPRDDDE